MRLFCWISIGLMTVVWVVDNLYSHDTLPTTVIIIMFLYLIEDEVSHIEQLLEKK